MPLPGSDRYRYYCGRFGHRLDGLSGPPTGIISRREFGTVYRCEHLLAATCGDRAALVFVGVNFEADVAAFAGLEGRISHSIARWVADRVRGVGFVTEWGVGDIVAIIPGIGIQAAEDLAAHIVRRSNRILLPVHVADAMIQPPARIDSDRYFLTLHTGARANVRETHRSHAYKSTFVVAMTVAVA